MPRIDRMETLTVACVPPAFRIQVGQTIGQLWTTPLGKRGDTAAAGTSMTIIEPAVTDPFATRGSAASSGKTTEPTCDGLTLASGAEAVGVGLARGAGL